MVEGSWSLSSSERHLATDIVDGLHHRYSSPTELHCCGTSTCPTSPTSPPHQLGWTSRGPGQWGEDAGRRGRMQSRERATAGRLGASRDIARWMSSLGLRNGRGRCCWVGWARGCRALEFSLGCNAVKRIFGMGTRLQSPSSFRAEFYPNTIIVESVGRSCGLDLGRFKR